MDTYKIRVQDFEGPLDLLIQLIAKDKIDIYDIPIVSITQQYISYINSLQEYNLDIASEFLVMAAMLLQIKSKMLLPKLPSEVEDETDPRQMLVEMLVEYRKFKKRAAQLREKLAWSSQFIAKKPMVFPHARRKLKPMVLNDLLKALANLVSEEEIATAVIPRQEYHVQDKMQEIMNLLSENDSALSFARALNYSKSRSEEIAGFLAVLELLRLKKITIRQREAFAPIYLFLREEA